MRLQSVTTSPRWSLLGSAAGTSPETLSLHQSKNLYRATLYAFVLFLRHAPRAELLLHEACRTAKRRILFTDTPRVWLALLNMALGYILVPCPDCFRPENYARGSNRSPAATVQTAGTTAAAYWPLPNW